MSPDSTRIVEVATVAIEMEEDEVDSELVADAVAMEETAEDEVDTVAAIADMEVTAVDMEEIVGQIDMVVVDMVADEEAACSVVVDDRLSLVLRPHLRTVCMLGTCSSMSLLRTWRRSLEISVPFRRLLSPLMREA